MSETGGDITITGGSEFDRRSLIKKAAVGGAVAWVAPAVLSTAAHAQASDAGTIVGNGLFTGEPVELYTTDGGSLRGPGGVLLDTKNADVDGKVSFAVQGGKTYYLRADSCGFLGFPTLVGVGQTVTQSCD